MCAKKLILLSFIGTLILTACEEKEAYLHPVPQSLDEHVILPPEWAFGVLYGGYTDQKQTIGRIQQIQDHDYPIDAYWIDSWFWSFDDEGEGPDKYLDFVSDTIAYPNRKEMWDFMEQNHIKGGFWTWDAIQKTGNEEAFEDFEQRGFFRDTYMNTNPWHNAGTSTAMFQEDSDHPGTLTGNINFDNPEAAAYFKERMKPFFDEGADFLKLDRTTHLNTVKTIFEISQEFGKETEGRGFMLSHAGGLEDSAFKRYPTKWTSDTRSDWTIESPNIQFNSWVPNVAFKENIAMYTNPDKLHHTVPFLTNDTGGFDMGITDSVDEELYIRWLQFSMYGPITEVFSQPENPTSNLAWKYSERADSLFRTYAHRRMQLFPYIYSYAHKTRLDGENMIRLIPDHLYEYTFGEEFLVAPVYEEYATERTVYLPEGTWINYWTGEITTGNRSITVNAPIDQIPLFVKAGSIIPLRNYAPNVETGTNEKLTLELYPGADGDFELIEDDGLSNEYLKGRYALTTITFSQNETVSIAPVLGDYIGMPEQRSWRLKILSPDTVSAITVNGKELSFKQDGKFLLTDFVEFPVSEKVIFRIQN